MSLWFVMMLIAEGLIVGVVALGIAPQRGSMSIPGTVGLGLAGSFLGGVMAWTFVNAGVGVVFAAIGATALLYTRRRFLEHG